MEKDKFLKIILWSISLISLLLSIIAIIRTFYRNIELQFDYLGIIIGVLSILFTILIGWNIWSIIENRGLEYRVKRQLNYAHNKIDYNLGIIYGDFSQMIAMNVSNGTKELLKVLMLMHMVNSLKILSKFPDTNQEVNSIANTIANVMETTKSICINSKDAQSILELFGEIDRRENIEGLTKIKEELFNFIINGAE